MKNYLLILGAILAIFLSVKTFVQVDLPKATTTNSSKFSLETKTDSAGEVEVQVTPLSIQTGSETKFSVSLNTHSVELSYDLTTIAYLTDDLGRRANNPTWDGGKGGHHLSGTLVFPAVLADAKTITLTIESLAGQNRVFSWSLK